MGEIRKQNEALTARILKAILVEVEADWHQAPQSTVRGELKEFATALLIAFGATL